MQPEHVPVAAVRPSASGMLLSQAEQVTWPDFQAHAGVCASQQCSRISHGGSV